MPTVQVGPVSVAYGKEGAGEAFVLLHGTTGTRQHWMLQAPVLAERYLVLTPEYPGSGETLDPGGPIELDDLVAHVAAVADAEGVARFHLAGWSLGAVVAAAVAAALPDRVRSVALVNGWATTDARMRFTFDLWRRLFEADRDLFARYTFADGLTRGSFELLGDGIEALIPLAAAGFQAGTSRQLELDMRIDVAGRLTLITAPALVVGGTEDRWVDVAHSRHLAEAIRGARLVELPCGHLVPNEQAEALNALLLEHAAGAV